MHLGPLCLPEHFAIFTRIFTTVHINAYAVLITSFPQEILTLAQGYRDRADAENPFDELKITGARAQVKYLRGRELEPRPPLPAPA